MLQSNSIKWLLLSASAMALSACSESDTAVSKPQQAKAAQVETQQPAVKVTSAAGASSSVAQPAPETGAAEPTNPSVAVEKASDTSEEAAALNSAQPAPSEDAAATEARLRRVIAQQVGNVPVDRISPSRLPGIYEVVAARQVIYISDDGRFLFPGPLLEVSQGQLVSLTEATLREIDMEKAPQRAELISQVAEENMVIFKAPKEQYVLTVFTDVNCVYCRKLHENMQGYLDRGITVRYLAFPRDGIGSAAYNKLVSVWCAKDRQLAMDNAKLHNKFSATTCDNPVADQYSLTRQMGLNGTPAIILANGELISGFMEPERLITYLNSKANTQVSENR